jgi:hypothetical protein
MHTGKKPEETTGGIPSRETVVLNQTEQYLDIEHSISVGNWHISSSIFLTPMERKTQLAL